MAIYCGAGQVYHMTAGREVESRPVLQNGSASVTIRSRKERAPCSDSRPRQGNVNKSSHLFSRHGSAFILKKQPWQPSLSLKTITPSDLVAYNLERAGHAPVTAYDGLTALEVARRDKPDLILLDQMMPGMDGHGVLRELRRDSRTQGIPVIFLAAKAPGGRPHSGAGTGRGRLCNQTVQPQGTRAARGQRAEAGANTRRAASSRNTAPSLLTKTP